MGPYKLLDPDAASALTVIGVDGEEYTVGAVAGLAGVSVRTLHHYDRIGLLSPSQRSPVGYRLYTLEDLKRLQQILYYRELGFAPRTPRRTGCGSGTKPPRSTGSSWPR